MGMPPGLAITLVLIAACTAFALKPVRRPAPVSLASYLLGLVVNEIPFAIFLYVVIPVMTLAFADEHSRSMAWGLDAYLLLVTAGLAYIWWRQQDAVNEVEDAVDVGGTHHWVYPYAEEHSPVLSKAPGTVRILAAPFPVRRADVRRAGNISYGDAGRRNLLDVYHHRDLPRDAPVLVYFHGGSFNSGNKRREGRPLILRLASRGWVCISANYRLRPEASFVDWMTDVKKVIAWAKDEGSGFGADPQSVFVAGSSAGGHMAAVAGLTASDPVFQQGFEETDTSVAGFIGMYGYYGGLDGEPVPSSPLDYLKEDAPPAFLAHGDIDTVVKVEGARRFAARLGENSKNPVTYVELSGAQHGFDLLHSERMERVSDGIETWAARVIRAASDPEPSRTARPTR